jgi:hypothetical protein
MQLPTVTDNMFQLGWLLHPIFSAAGDYPPIMKKWLAQKSKEDGYRRSRLPTFTAEEVQMVRGAFDLISTKFGCRNQAGILMFSSLGIQRHVVRM